MDGRIDAGDPSAEDQFDVVLGVPALGVNVDLLLLRLALQVLLRQRRPLVRPLLLLADEDDAASEALVAKSRRRHRTGQAGARDHVRLASLVRCHAHLLYLTVDLRGEAPSRVNR